MRLLADDPSPIPKRFIVFFMPNGVEKPEWMPAHDPEAPVSALNDLPVGHANASFRNTLDPLRMHREKINIFSNHAQPMWNNDSIFSVHGITATTEQGAGGHEAIRCVTGGSPTDATRALNQSLWNSAHASIDQIVADHVSVPGMLRSLELGFGVTQNNGGGSMHRRMSWRGPDESLPIEEDPLIAYARAFDGFVPSGGAGPSPEVTRELERRRTRLRYTRDQLARYRNQLGAADRMRLDQHEAAIRDLEARLSGTSGGGGLACSPHAIDGSGETAPDRLERHMDVLVQSFLCDRTRVGSIVVGGSQSNLVCSWAGASAEWHSISHSGPTEHYIAINRWVVEVFSRLLTRLSEARERDGSSLLDHTLVYFTNENSNGNSHTVSNLPVMTAGGAWALQTGKLLRVDRPVNDLLLTLGNAMGCGLTSVGAAGCTTGPIAELMR